MGSKRPCRIRTDDKLLRMDRMLLSTLLKECGLKGSAKWFVAEGAEK